MLPLILCPESVCLPQAGITACPLSLGTEQAVNVKTFPEGGYSVNRFRGRLPFSYGGWHRDITVGQDSAASLALSQT